LAVVVVVKNLKWAMRIFTRGNGGKENAKEGT